ncbi:hypothetical protein [Streptomyces sp. CNQ085]|uniref:hypothetical protein n=1 Tax=Streptomyces sp. CNQ085 TaxID=2886944 RepID=UPI001F50CDCE|nr:hypothetical protein [Streptomyces sp. CNQ085]MCI0386200.1 hypothetical protein [Streptomyces sp. CNQ085]
MTEIDIRENSLAPAAPAEDVPPPARRRTRDLVAWAEEARAAYAVAESLAKTSFVPAQFRGKPGECTAAILTGNEMGLSPMASLRSFDLIQGTPAMRANAMRGVVQSRGHEIWEEKISPTRVVVCGQRKGSDKVHRSEWTIERAEGLRLTGKDNWKSQPQAMLLARATAEVCRMTASDVLYGVPYAAEELADQDETGAADKPRRKARRKAAEAPPAPEPEFPQPEPEEPAGQVTNREEQPETVEELSGEPGDPWADGAEPAAGGWPTVARPGQGVPA